MEPLFHPFLFLLLNLGLISNVITVFYISDLHIMSLSYSTVNPCDKALAHALNNLMVLPP